MQHHPGTTSAFFTGTAPSKRTARKGSCAHPDPSAAVPIPEPPHTLQTHTLEESQRPNGLDRRRDGHILQRRTVQEGHAADGGQSGRQLQGCEA
mmetsp:Transcript_8073/g.12064  ORF Transcript_8073/g.12064 Transcript_8073/m.12064 type:complete len:94 (-) Transcript_8073:980-1261(-)